MTITFENDNDVIVYALEKVISFARNTQQIFVAQCVWWLASIIGLEQGLVKHIDNLESRSYILPQEPAPVLQKEISTTSIKEAIGKLSREISATPRDIQEDSRSCIRTNYVHPGRIQQIEKETPGLEEEYDSELNQQSRVLKEADRFLQLSKRSKLFERSIWKKDKRPKRDNSQTEGIDSSELQRRRSAGECLRCAWPSDRKGTHRVADCKRPIKLDQGKAKDQLSQTRSGKAIAKPVGPLSNKQRNYLQSLPKDTIALYLADRK